MKFEEGKYYLFVAHKSGYPASGTHVIHRKGDKYFTVYPESHEWVAPMEGEKYREVSEAELTILKLGDTKEES